MIPAWHKHFCLVTIFFLLFRFQVNFASKSPNYWLPKLFHTNTFISSGENNMIILILTSAILAFLSVDGTPVTALQSHSNYHVYRYGHANVHIACLNKCKKARVCPSVTDSVNTTCTNSCTTVADCPSQHQCCNNSCGRQCQPEGTICRCHRNKWPVMSKNILNPKLNKILYLPNSKWCLYQRVCL